MCWYVKVYWRVFCNFLAKLSRESMECCAVNIISPVTGRTINGNRVAPFNGGECLHNKPQLGIISGDAISSVETQPYYFNVDRFGAEDFLKNRAEGTFLVRPYYGKNPQVEFVVSITNGSDIFYHIFLRRTIKRSYTIGQSKLRELTFKTPVDVFQYYHTHDLRCYKLGYPEKDLKLVPIF